MGNQVKDPEFKVQVDKYIPGTKPDAFWNFLYALSRGFYVCIYFYFLPFAVVIFNYFQIFYGKREVQYSPGIFENAPATRI